MNCIDHRHISLNCLIFLTKAIRDALNLCGIISTIFLRYTLTKYNENDVTNYLDVATVVLSASRWIPYRYYLKPVI